MSRTRSGQPHEVWATLSYRFQEIGPSYPYRRQSRARNLVPTRPQELRAGGDVLDLPHRRGGGPRARRCGATGTPSRSSTSSRAGRMTGRTRDRGPSMIARRGSPSSWRGHRQGSITEHFEGRRRVDRPRLPARRRHRLEARDHPIRRGHRKPGSRPKTRRRPGCSGSGRSRDRGARPDHPLNPYCAYRAADTEHPEGREKFLLLAQELRKRAAQEATRLKFEMSKRAR
jgi:hypothetical protein